MSSIRKKIMIAGAGGINSWLVGLIADLIDKDQIPLSWEFTIFDGDNVEKKNLLYQNFGITDLPDNKAETLAKRYNIFYKDHYIEKTKDFDTFDFVICGVDNRDFREMLFIYMNEHPDKDWLDMRAEGRGVAIFAKHPKNTLEVMLKTLPDKGAKATSCQLEYELSSGIVQLGNRIIAQIGAQYLLNRVRGEMNPPQFTHRF